LNKYEPTPSAMPKHTREKIKKFTDKEITGVNRVIIDQIRTEKVSIFLPPNFFEKLPPMIYEKVKKNLNFS
jgi:hypothetical protein